VDNDCAKVPDICTFVPKFVKYATMNAMPPLPTATAKTKMVGREPETVSSPRCGRLYVEEVLPRTSTKISFGIKTVNELCSVLAVIGGKKQ
jgi:hypothetical protein